MHREEIAIKILTQAEDTLAIIYGRKVRIHHDIEWSTASAAEDVINAYRTVTGNDIHDYKSRKSPRSKQTEKHVLIYMLVTWAKINAHQVAKMLGLNHTTVLYALGKIKDFIKVKDYQTLQLIYKMESQLGI